MARAVDTGRELERKEFSQMKDLVKMYTELRKDLREQERHDDLAEWSELDLKEELERLLSDGRDETNE